MHKYRLFQQNTVLQARGENQPARENFDALERALSLRALLFGLSLFALGIALGYYLGAREAAHLIAALSN